jgi:hypothetical protein
MKEVAISSRPSAIPRYQEDILAQLLPIERVCETKT